MLQTKKVGKDLCAVAFDPTEILIRKSGKAYFGKELPLATLKDNTLVVDERVAQEFDIAIKLTNHSPAGCELEGYERYQLEWMIAHGYSIRDLIQAMYELQYDDPEDSDYISQPVTDLFEDWESDCGFPGAEIWVCEDEWAASECAKREE